MPTPRQFFRFTKSIVKDVCGGSAAIAVLPSIAWCLSFVKGDDGICHIAGIGFDPGIFRHVTGCISVGIWSIFALTVLYFMIDGLYNYFTEKWEWAEIEEITRLRSIQSRVTEERKEEKKEEKKKEEKKKEEKKKEPEKLSRYDLINQEGDHRV